MAAEFKSVGRVRIDIQGLLYAGGGAGKGPFPVNGTGVWAVRRLDRFYQLGRRHDHFTRVQDFDRQLATLDKDLERRLKELEDALAEATRGKLGRL